VEDAAGRRTDVQVWIVWSVDTLAPHLHTLHTLHACSCAVSILVNVSQFMCLGRFSAVMLQCWCREGARGAPPPNRRRLPAPRSHV
jgi:hypothetical protein